MPFAFLFLVLLLHLLSTSCADEPAAAVPSNCEASTKDHHLLLRFVDLKNRRYRQTDEHCSREKHGAAEAKANHRIAVNLHAPILPRWEAGGKPEAPARACVSASRRARYPPSRSNS